MNWGDQLIRIRRLLRDPLGLIWSEGMLLRIYNDEQNDLFNLLGVAQTVQALSIPPEFQDGYTFDWEWSGTDHESGEVYRFAYYDAGEQLAYTAIWEAEHLKGYAASSSSEGTTYTHPWEAWMCDPAEPPPIPLPDDFHSMVALYWDMREVEPTTKSELLNEGITTWRTETGIPINYWRGEESTNWMYLYPLPESDFPAEDAQGDPAVAEYAATGIAIAENLLCIYEQEVTEAVDSTDESLLPAWMQKYIEYGVAARAFRANTDGQITSLADYWDLRKLATLEAVKRYKLLRLKDRSLCMATQDRSASGRVPRRPRFPHHYPRID